MENRPILIRASEDVIVLEDEFKKINVELSLIHI